MAEFFRACQSIESSVKLRDLLLRRYGNIQAVYALPFAEGVELISYGLEQEERDAAFKQWVQYLPFMSMKMLEYVPFEQYFEKTTGRNIDLRSNEDIIAELEKLHGIKIEV